MEKHGLFSSGQIWICFLMGLIFCGIGCMSEAGTFHHLLLITGSVLMVFSYYAAFVLDVQARTQRNAEFS